MSENLCVDCGRTFVVGREQAARYAERGWAPPRRCPRCRTARREARAGATTATSTAGPSATTTTGAGSVSSSADAPANPPRRARAPSPPKEPPAPVDVEVQCAACGTLTLVHFKPTRKRPVYCQACYELR